MLNIVDLKTHHNFFKTPGIQFSVSSRKISPEISIIDYLKIFYMYTDFRMIDSVFGNTVTFSKLYGGRPFKTIRSLTDNHIRELDNNGIGLALTLTSHFFDEKAYIESQSLLKTNHKKGNSIICTNDELAAHIKNDFPDYIVKASIIKNINTIKKVNNALLIYDYVTLPMDKNDDDIFLKKINEKDRIILFGNASCAYTCPARTCYKGFSEKMSGKEITSVCSKKNKIARLDMGEVFFDIKKLKNMGFNNFKLVPLAPDSAQKVTIYLKNRK